MTVSHAVHKPAPAQQYKQLASEQATLVGGVLVVLRVHGGLNEQTEPDNV